MLTAHTRLVRARGRADTRAKTEPRLARGTDPPPRVAETTSPYPRSFQPDNEGRESLPYLELEIATDKQDTLAAHDEATTEKRPPLRVVKTVSRKLGIGTGREQALPLADPAASKAVDPVGPTEAVAKLEADDLPTSTLAKQDPDIDERPTGTIAKQDDPDERTTGAVATRAQEPDIDLDRSTERVVKMLESLTEPDGPKPRPSRLSWLGVVLTPPQVGAALVIGTWLRPEFCVTSPITHVFPREDGTLVQTTTKSRYFVGPDGDTYLVRRTR